MTGRGFGKTLTGANWALTKGLSEPGIWVAVCAPTFADVKNTCFEGPSGIKSAAQPGEIIDHNKNDLRITLRNGSIIQGFSAEKPESIRGSNLAYCWFDELGIIRYPEFYEAGLLPALRVSKGQLMITTTPRNTKLLRDIIKEAEKNPEEVHFTRATSSENWKAAGVTKMIQKVTSKFGEGTFLERQELQGEFIAEIPGALFQFEWFDEYRIEDGITPEFRRIVVAVDPAATSSIKSDETGIVVAAEGEDHHLYVLQDCSLQGTPDKVMEALISAYYRWNCSLVIGEKNMVGDYFKEMLYGKDPYIPFKTIHAMNSKKIRAQPISPLAEQGRLHMVGPRGQFEELERQLCALTSYDDRVKAHDDRADACVKKGSPILTPSGEIPIENIRVGDEVWTRAGWKPVTAVQCTQQDAEVMAIVLSDGRELAVTPDHRVWTENRGWVTADALTYGDILSAWKKPQLRSYTKASRTIGIRKANGATIASTINSMTRSRDLFATCIAKFGKIATPGRKSRKDGIFIMKMKTRSTTIRPTWFSSPLLSMVVPMLASIGMMKKTRWSTWSAFVLSPLNGMVQRKVTPGIPSMASVPGNKESSMSARASAAACLSVLTGLMLNFARRNAGHARRARITGMMSRFPVRCAVLSSGRTSTGQFPQPVPVSAVRSYVEDKHSDVYDLTVADVHEFTASGVIVHNCVYALRELCGFGAVNYKEIYGFTACKGCDRDVHAYIDKRCKACGTPVVTPAKEVDPMRKKSAIRWSAAYYRTCPEGHEYPLKLGKCPECSPDPGAYMAQVAKMSHANNSGWSYTNRDWLSGRKVR